jgi:hypothetical protein
MKQKLKTKTVKLISVQDWDEFVSNIYGKPYSFQQQDGCKERGIHKFSAPDPYENEFDYENTSIPFEVNGNEMGVSFQTWLNTSPKDTLKHFENERENNLFWERNFYPDVSMIVNDLHSKGILEEGEYVIEIDW